MNYQRAYFFTKHTNLSAFFEANKTNLCGMAIDFDNDPYHNKIVENTRKRYSMDKPIHLILLVRYDVNPIDGTCKTMCKINCPINPLPVKGEFETPSVRTVINSLNSHGWMQNPAMPSIDLGLFE